MVPWKGVIRFVTHGKSSLVRAIGAGWRAGARYTNLRDIRGLPFMGEGFLDIDWKNYSFERHLDAASKTKPLLTVARDIFSLRQLDSVLKEAERLTAHARFVIVVPKSSGFSGRVNELIPKDFLLGYSVPTSYGATRLLPRDFTRPVHLLGGRPDVQRKLAEFMPVVSLDCNRFTLDAAFGDYFDGRAFRPHPIGGYHKCLDDSLVNIARLWVNYAPRDNRKSANLEAV